MITIVVGLCSAHPHLNVHLHVNDCALQSSEDASASAKSLARGAWDSGDDIIEDYMPFAFDKAQTAGSCAEAACALVSWLQELVGSTSASARHLGVDFRHGGPRPYGECSVRAQRVE